MPVLRRMEARGQIRGGRFVNGFTGEQFARPEALDLLRAVRRAGELPNVPDIPSADPLNLTGIILPGSRVSRLATSIPLVTKHGGERRHSWQPPGSPSATNSVA